MVFIATLLTCGEVPALELELMQLVLQHLGERDGVGQHALELLLHLALVRGLDGGQSLGAGLRLRRRRVEQATH